MRERLLRASRWLLPGLSIKRWFVVSLLGIAMLADAVDRWVVAQGAGWNVNELLDGIVADYFPPGNLTWILLLLGLLLLFAGTTFAVRGLFRAATARGSRGTVDALTGLRLREGYKVVAIGGGTGLSTLLRGLKRRTSNLTAIVTVSDDGGSSGRLTKELGVLPPGDIRNCLVALADDEALVTDLFRYRFNEGEGLLGHSFGNIFLAAMTSVTGSFDRAIQESSRVLNIVGSVLPATLGRVCLCAELDDGSTVVGESQISLSKQPIARVFLEPSNVPAFEQVIAAIRDADAIVLGPGSLYTSVLPNLLVDRVAREIAAARAVKIYVCNVMTQPGETTGMTAADHVRALLANAGERVCDYAIVNDEPPKRLLAAYAEEGQGPVVPDIDRVEQLGLVPIPAAVISEHENVRHDPDRLANVVFSVINRHVADRATFVKLPSVRARLKSEPARRPT
ncbi:MAG TPA: gluconeogenesis factor YvcK family protein [Candidatus Tyrphobacter sp.]